MRARAGRERRAGETGQRQTNGKPRSRTKPSWNPWSLLYKHAARVPQMIRCICAKLEVHDLTFHKFVRGGIAQFVIEQIIC